ncbi:MAG: hypothetical protein Q4D58_11955 [Synergistaceae bacterium]|nr:hypothetical protein [Synergistaceae bacterium]
MKTKLKVIGAVVMVLGLAGAAAAYGPGGGMEQRGDSRPPQLTQEQRAQFDAMRKIRGELREEMRSEKPDKSKARALFAKELDMRESMLEARFNEFLSNREAHKDWRRFSGPGGRAFAENNKPWRDLCEELRKEYPNKAKAKEYFAEASKIRREHATARFEEMLKDPSKYEERYGRRHDRRTPNFCPNCGTPLGGRAPRGEMRGSVAD